MIASFDPKGTDTWLQELIAGVFGDRVMLGTDQMRWPDAIGMAIDVIQSSKTLNRSAKTRHLYSNAARFLRLTKQ